MLEIEDLAPWLPGEVLELYKKEGIRELYPPQAEAVERGLLEGKSLLVSVPTAAGKTMLAELAMLKAALSGGRSLYIVPLRALASEKHEAFSRFSDLGVSVGLSSGDMERRDEYLGRNQIVVATSEKADSLIRNGARWIRDLSVLVVDEIHLLDSTDRGPTLEMTMTKLLNLNPNIQILGLSATVANAREVASWLNADLVESRWRPVELKEGVICDGVLHFPGEKVSIPSHGDDLIDLIEDTMNQGGQILIFESSRRNAEATASKLAKNVSRREKARSLTRLSEKILATGESDTARRLAESVRSGVAFHHAGLLSEQRAIVERGFRSGQIRAIASTPTLAAGLNLPARRVLIRSYKRYQGARGMVAIPVMEYRQMAGRAGRPGLDPRGEAFLMAKNEAETRDLLEHYVQGEPEEIFSKLAMEPALRTHLLSTMATGFAENADDLKRFISSTFYAHQQDAWHLDATIEKVLSFLIESGMMEEDLRPTPLGELVSRLYIDPLTARIVVDNLRTKEKITDLTILHLITMTPDMDTLYVQTSDGWIEEFIHQHYGELCPEENFDWMMREAKTAALLLDWISEEEEERIADRFRVGPGDIRRVAETAEWLIHSAGRLSEHLDLGATFRIYQLEKRVHYGAGPDLLSLLDLKGVGRVRARKLHRAGYTSLDKLRGAKEPDIAEILGPRIAEKVFSQLRYGERDGSS
ncbi:ATP-dependent DNA helicase [Candidatus Methanocrinis natronophilus]|uniref:ATP-dependent DNA helicase Hel308 n=1 Tax=Candidatus Methanocrinis natronophilus TaxID=3033396 RepID=A0ABT5X8K1_9EURY|nr:ATP-dependent DNA helicase [Candidatus Methanocrinis natronophilus]MDF0591035.1 ATP-dependent DNA helicase [Candidatus Methanocrinis natronophilus]